VALVGDEGSAAFARSVAAEYMARTGLSPRVYVCRATNGAELVT